MLCLAMPLGWIIACFVIRLAWHGLHGGGLDVGFAWAAVAVIVLTFGGAFVWVYSPR